VNFIKRSEVKKKHTYLGAVEDMKDTEIAAQFDIKPASVREYLTRARRKALATMRKGGVINEA
jgi:DNA-directed RNA polymerase specialized sigma24 family protein